MGNSSLSVAVIGGGAAGIAAAYLLQRRHRVTIYERNAYLGGHTRTIVLPEGPDAGAAIDTGFIVLNDRTYPILNKVLKELGIALQDSEMSFSYTNSSRNFCYNGSSLNGLFAQRRNLINPRFLLMLKEILRFNQKAREDLHAGRLAGLTLQSYMLQSGYSKTFQNDYLYPMAAAIWSTAPSQMPDFPAEYILAFYENHGLLALSDRPQWKTVQGGSFRYVHAFEKAFQGKIYLNAAIRRMLRTARGITLEVDGIGPISHDAAIVATHADEALLLLADPSPLEAKALGAWQYARNRVVLHRDESSMPPVQRAWASWNYGQEGSQNGAGAVSLTYYMNRLQRLGSPNNYFVSLNRQKDFPAHTVIDAVDLDHPIYTFASMESQRLLSSLNGENNTYYCGAHFGHGFHEDAFRSGTEVAGKFGIFL